MSFFVIFTDTEIPSNQTLFGPFLTEVSAEGWSILKQDLWGQGKFDILEPTDPFPKPAWVPPSCIRCKNANWIMIGHSCGKSN